MRSRRSGVRAWVATGCLIALGAIGPACAATFNGTVFEDVNYGGGAGRPLLTPGVVGIAGVRVELYNVGTGALVASVNTGVGGTYSLTSGDTSAQMRVRVVNGSVRSSRMGGSGCTTCVPVQTYRTGGSGNGVAPVTNRVGGEDPRYSDAISNTAPVTYGTLTVAGTRLPQSITTVTPSANNSIIANIDFGFNFDTVVNTRDAG